MRHRTLWRYRARERYRGSRRLTFGYFCFMKYSPSPSSKPKNPLRTCVCVCVHVYVYACVYTVHIYFGGLMAVATGPTARSWAEKVGTSGHAGDLHTGMSYWPWCAEVGGKGNTAHSQWAAPPCHKQLFRTVQKGCGPQLRLGAASHSG